MEATAEALPLARHIDVPDWEALGPVGTAAMVKHCRRLVAMMSYGHHRAAEWAEKAVPDDANPAALVVVSFWFGGEALFGGIGSPKPAADALTAGALDSIWQDIWFAKGVHQAAVDKAMNESFGVLLLQASSGKLDQWATHSPVEALALIVVLDQFSRNIHRGTTAAWATDAAALSAFDAAEAAGFVDCLPPAMKCMLAMPLVHAEDSTRQDQFACIVAGAAEDAATNQSAVSQWFWRFRIIAKRHADVILEFGRFPERNSTLERPSTAAESAYLKAAQDGSTVKTAKA